MPAWSVPPGLIVPNPRQLPAEAPQTEAPPAEAPQTEVQPAEALSTQERPAVRPARDDRSWPGVAPPAGWFLRTYQPRATADHAARAAQGDTPAVPSPHREPDGSWSSPLTPGPAPQALGPTQARYGRAGGPGFQRSRPRPPSAAGQDAAGQDAAGQDAAGQDAAGQDAGVSAWQRSYRLWSEAGIQWEQPQPRSRPTRPGTPGRVQVPLGAPVFSGTDGDTAEDKWGDDRPPIWERPAGLVTPRAPGESRRRRPDDTLLLDHRMPGSRRRPRGGGRRTVTIVVPAVVLVAVAVLALALLTGHGPRFGPLASDKNKTQNTVAPQLPLAPVTFDTYPGQQQRGVFQTVNRIVAVGSTLVTMGSQASDGVVRQQFLVSVNAGASWQLAAVRGPGNTQPALGHPATLLAGGQGSWLAIGPQAIWTSHSGLTWTLAATHGIGAQLPGDSVWVLTKTAGGYLAAGANASHGANQAVIWTSRDGLTWQRMTAAQLGLAGPGESVQNIAYATSRGGATVIAGTVTGGRSTYDAAWLSTNGGAAWTRLTIPADHGAGPEISGLGFDGAGVIAVRPGRTVTGAADGIVYFSPNGQAWQYSATIDAAGGWTPGLVKGSDYGFVVTGATAQGQIIGYTSTGTATNWLPTSPLGDAASQSVVGATVAPAGTIVAVGYTTGSKTGQQALILEAGTDGTLRSLSMTSLAGASIPELAVKSTAVAGGVQVAVGSANGYPAVWRKASGGPWTLVSSLALVAVDPHLRALTSVTHGPAGWLAVGAPGPVVLTSADGTVWGVAGGDISQDLAGVSAVAAAGGPRGYVIVGKLVAPGGSCVADVWWSPNLTSWTRAHDVNDATGSSQVLAVAADANGFVSVGSHNGQPAVWMTSDGRSWETIVLPLPAGATAAALQQVAINGSTVVALGQATTGNGPAPGSVTSTAPGAFPFAEFSMDGGQDWQQAPFSSPGPDTTFTALTADAAGFTAAGLFGPPGQQDVAVWTSAAGTSWKSAKSSGLNGSEAWQIDALAPADATVTGIGTIITQQSQQTVTFTLPNP